jgi:hypothetical protein
MRSQVKGQKPKGNSENQPKSEARSQMLEFRSEEEERDALLTKSSQRADGWRRGV